MPEYRHDSLTGRMVIVAEERASRPHQFDITDTPYRSACPFCEGNESLTPGEIAAFRRADSEPNTPGWRVRVVPNMYPAVLPGDRKEDTPFPSGGCPATLPSKTDGIGIHEVIIDTSRHVLSVSELSNEEVAEMLSMYRLRLQALRSDFRWAYVQIFKNVGAAAGASLPHSHSQLVALPFVPPPLVQMLSGSAEYARKHHRCCWCDHLRNELQSAERIVEETEHFVVLCPFVSRFAGEIEIYPKNHESGFDTVDVVLLDELAGLFRRTIIRLEKAVFWMKDPLAYNIVLSTEPFRFEGELPMFFHWRFSILPSLARAAGFEWGTGLHINPLSPEQAARRLREAIGTDQK
jgi:UDPglucose--hexose-1-phosphate uridylyltransferase